jgi:hypothetical protein
MPPKSQPKREQTKKQIVAPPNQTPPSSDIKPFSQRPAPNASILGPPTMIPSLQETCAFISTSTLYLFAHKRLPKSKEDLSHSTISLSFFNIWWKIEQKGREKERRL